MRDVFSLWQRIKTAAHWLQWQAATPALNLSPCLLLLRAELRPEMGRLAILTPASRIVAEQG